MKKYMYVDNNSAGVPQNNVLSEDEIRYVTYSNKATEEENKKAFDEYITKLGAVLFYDTSLHTFQNNVEAFLEAHPEHKIKPEDLLILEPEQLSKIISDGLWGLATLASFCKLSLSELADLSISTHTKPKD